MPTQEKRRYHKAYGLVVDIVMNEHQLAVSSQLLLLLRWSRLSLRRGDTPWRQAALHHYRPSLEFA